MIRPPILVPSRTPAGECLMPQPSGSIPVQVLLVEDSPDDADLMREALEGGDLAVSVSLVEDGEAALAFLHREGAYSAAPRPDLLLLDLSLQLTDGNEVLVQIQADPAPKRIP